MPRCSSIARHCRIAVFNSDLGPRLGARPRTATALIWQRGDACAMPYRAATPALALLRAAVTETSTPARRKSARRLPHLPRPRLVRHGRQQETDVPAWAGSGVSCRGEEDF
jgi:hypothetical protein